MAPALASPSRRNGLQAASRRDPAGASSPGAGTLSAGAWREVRALIWTHRKRLAIGMGLMLVSRFCDLVLPTMPKYLFDDVIGRGRWDLLPWLALLAGGATLLSAVASFLMSQIVGIAGQRAIADMRKDLQARVIRLPTQFFDKSTTGTLIARIMTDAEGVRNLIGTGLMQLLGSLVTAVMAFGVLLYLNRQMTSITLVIVAAFGLGIARAFSRLRPLMRERSAINAEVTSRLAEALGGVRVIKAYTAEGRESRLFAKGIHRLLRNIVKSLTGTSVAMAASSLVVGACAITMMLVGGSAIRNGTMTVGDLVMYLSFTGLMTLPVIQLASVGTQITEAVAGLDRIREIRRLAIEGDRDLTALPVEEIVGDVELRDVSFEYTPGIPVLKGVTCRVPAGSTTALVGSSGSGKSTLISLVMAFNRPTSGRIHVDGCDLSTMRLRDYRSHLGIVLQETFLFDGTVADNIRYAKPRATAEEIVRVSRIAHCDEFIETLEHKYETIVGERGVRLSGGQRQRIAIARAILADPRILVLDEATSSLDSESEALIQDGLRSLRRGRTTFVIAHRLSTIRSADQILVLEAGEIVERGTHEALLALGGRYRKLYDKQYSFERERFVNPGEEFAPQPARAVARRLPQPSLTI